MGVKILHWAEQINAGSQPVLMFPICANTLSGSISLVSVSEGTFSGGEVGTGIWGGTDITSGGFTNIALPGQGLSGFITEYPVPGQLFNLNAWVSKDGNGFTLGLGQLSEIGFGVYSYTPSNTETDNPPTWQSSNHGSVYIRINPVDPYIIPNNYISETHLHFRIRPPGLQTVSVAGNDKGVLQALSQPGPSNPITNLQNYFNQGLRDILGNQLTNKPTFTRDR